MMGFLAWAFGLGTPWLAAFASCALAMLSAIYLERLVPTLGRIVTMLLLGVALFFGGYGRGYGEAHLLCEQQAAQTRLDKAKMDLKNVIAAGERAAAALQRQASLDAQNQEYVRQIEILSQPKEDEGKPANDPQAPRDVCRGLSDDDVGRLLRIQ